MKTYYCLFFILFCSISYSQSTDESKKIEENLLQKIKKSNSSRELKILINIINRYKIKEYQNSIPSGIPVIPLDTLRISSVYGYRYHPILKKKCFHQGIDFCSKILSFVIATADGRVIQSGIQDDEHGIVIKLEHKYGFSSKYSHLAYVFKEKGSFIKKGDTIALLGNTGRSTGPHLHYEIHKNDKHINPKIFMQ